MRSSTIAIAAVLSVAGMARAEPPKLARVRAVQPQQRPAEVSLAAAETTHAPPPDAAQPNAAAPKRRIARVTTCRCGDPQVNPDNQEQ